MNLCQSDYCVKGSCDGCQAVKEIRALRASRRRFRRMGQDAMWALLRGQVETAKGQIEKALASDAKAFRRK